MSQNSSVIGPPLLPDRFASDSKEEYKISKLTSEHESISSHDRANRDTVEDVQSETKIIGPVLPPHLQKQSTSREYGCFSGVDDSKTSDSSPGYDVYGPALPPHLMKSSLTSSRSHLKQQNESFSGGSHSSEDDVIGPVPEGVDNKTDELSFSQRQLEIRARYLKRKMAEEGSTPKDKISRESWMLELPPEKARNLGLGPRSFRMKEGPDMSDRSDWTDTPADRDRKMMLLNQGGCNSKTIEEDMKVAVINERDKEMERMVEKCKDEKRQLSLLEMHQKKLKKQKKEKKKKGEKPERRPFDRNIDLQANRFDEAQKKSIFKKAQLLDTRFSRGQSKYL